MLKDFLSGGFPVCALSITKSCSAQVDPNGTTIDYSMKGIVTNTGIGTMYGVQVFDTIAPAVTSGPGINVSNNTIVNGVNSPNYGTSTLGAGETGTWSDSDQSASLNQSDSAIAKGATDPSGSPQNTTSTTPATASCGTTPVGTLTVASGSDVHVQVSYNGNICNTGNSQVTGLALTDYEHTSTSPTSPTPAPLLSTLAPCTSDGKGGCTNASACTTYSSTYVATTDTPILDGFGNPGTGPGRFNFDDLIVITGAHATVGSLNTVTSGDSRCNSTATAPVYGCATITCPICQGSGECTP
ncbi:MAG: hypothetical protein DMG79_03010 [Acidobacteria bacterium]|nr:MAG: hypothetical protein DMG79_03010 [Acidobacteriota bacterium]